jgi:hypothetical protein
MPSFCVGLLTGAIYLGRIACSDLRVAVSDLLLWDVVRALKGKNKNQRVAALYVARAWLFGNGRVA